MAKVELDAPRRVHVSDPRLADAWKTKSARDMTEAEILAMPESEYMNDKQLEYFRATLQRLKDDLLSNADETTEHLREDTSIVPDPADRATIEEEHALELRTRDRERKLLKKISQSLARIDLLPENRIPFLGERDGYRIMLLEFPHSHIPVGADKFVAWLLARNIRPMIAHPERNKDLMRDPGRIELFVRMGCLLQVTADAITGGFGELCALRAREYLERGACSIVQVDCARIGGITPWLKVAHLAETFNVPVCPHFLMELHVSLCGATPAARWAASRSP